METLTMCRCGNDALPGMDECEWCEGHMECLPPEGVTLYRARLSGAPVARCDVCGHTWGLWDCVCELVCGCK